MAAEQERRTEQERRAKEERRAEQEVEEVLALEQRRREDEGFERSMRKKLSGGDLLTMHKEGRTYSHETIVQVVELNKDDSGKLHSIALSDGEYVSHNIETPSQVMVEGLKRFDLVQINSAHVKKDMISLNAIDHLELTNRRGESVQINKPILGVEVDRLRKLNPATLKLWGIRFEKTTNVDFKCKKEVANLDATILRVDPALAVVGGCSQDADESQATRPKRKLFQCSYCVRSFSEEEKLVQHIDAEHFME